MPETAFAPLDPGPPVLGRRATITGSTPARASQPLPFARPRTLLLVEDSRHAAEAVRILARRLGMRLRRAEDLATARRHLQVYRPDVALVDLGLPDGTGLDLIAELAAMRPRPRRIVAISADPDAGPEARAAGACAFVGKPFRLPADLPALLGAQDAGADLDRPALTGAGHRGLPGDPAEAGAGPDGLSGAGRNAGGDPLALCDDLRRAGALLAEPEGAGGASPGPGPGLGTGREPKRASGLARERELALDYATAFLQGIARCTGDLPLLEATRRARVSRDGSELVALVQARSAEIRHSARAFLS